MVVTDTHTTEVGSQWLVSAAWARAQSRRARTATAAHAVSTSPTSAPSQPSPARAPLPPSPATDTVVRHARARQSKKLQPISRRSYPLSTSHRKLCTKTLPRSDSPSGPFVKTTATDVTLGMKTTSRRVEFCTGEAPMSEPSNPPCSIPTR